MKIEFIDNIFELDLYPQYEDIRQSKDMKCLCTYSDYTINRFNMIGYADTTHGYMAVFECKKCGEIYRHHIGSNSRNTIEGFKKDAGLALYLKLTR